MTLQSLREKLAVVPGLLVSERGTAKAAFLYIRSPNRAVEVYVEGNSYFVECWDNADEESDDPPVRRDVVASESDAVDKIKNWLRGMTNDGNH